MESMRCTKTSVSRRSDKAVQGTNDSSILSKSSSAAAGYFTDPFLQYFAAKTVRRAPLINRGYYIRSWMINHVIQMFLQRNSDTKKQIISLGCGFDTLYFRLKASGKLTDTVVAEIDFPALMKKKHVLIKNKQELKDLLGEQQTPAINSPHIELCCTDYKLLGADLTQHNLLEAALRLCGIDFDLPTLILSECVLTYMTKRCSSEVIKWAADTFQENAVFVLYEQILPNDSFGLFMQKHYNVIGAPLKCINSFPTLESQKQRAVSLGWSWCEAYDMNEIYHGLISPSERERVENIEPFDEYEEWHLKCSHYFVLCAYSSPCTGLLKDPSELASNRIDISKDWLTVSEIPPSSSHLKSSLTLQRFSHSSSVISGKFLITVGGFGMQDGKHQRVSDVAVTDIVTMTTHIYKPKEYFEFPRMHHTSVALANGTVLVICGRNSPFSLCKDLVVYNLTYPENLCNQKNQSIRESQDNEEVQSNQEGQGNHKSQNNNEGQDNHEGQEHHEGQDNQECKCNCVCQCNQNLSTSALPSALATSATTASNDLSNSNQQLVSGDTGSNHRSDLLISDSLTVNSDSHPISSTSHDVVKEPLERNDVNTCCLNAGLHQSACDNSKSTKAFSEPPDSKLSETVTRTVHYECQHTNSDESKRNGEIINLQCSLVKQIGDVPCPRWRHATAVVNIEGKEYVFLYGGRTSTDTALSDSYLLDTENNTWKKLSCDGNVPGCRQSHSLTSWSPGKLLLSGGLNKDLIPVSSVHVLHLDTLVWEQLKMDGAEIPRYSHTAHVKDDFLILVGGVNCSNSSPGISVVNLCSGVVQHFSFPDPDKDKLLLCNKHTSVLQDGCLTVVGGGGNCFSFGTLLNRSPVKFDISKCFPSSS